MGLCQLTLNAEFPATWRSHALAQHEWLWDACATLLAPSAAVDRLIEPLDGVVHVHLPCKLGVVLQENILSERIQTFIEHACSDPVGKWNLGRWEGGGTPSHHPQVMIRPLRVAR